jgi:carbamoyl-phosphate synthase large subunit
MKKKTITILLTGSGTTTAVSVIKGIKQQHEFSVRLITCDRSDNVSGRYMADRFYKVPSAEDPSFLSAMLRIVKIERVNLIIPIIDYEFILFAKNKSKFEQLGAVVVLSDLPVRETCTNKFKTMELFRRLAIPHPKSYTPADIEKMKRPPAYPLFLKPSIFGRSTLDSYTIRNKKDLAYYSSLVDRPIIQEYINGTEITVDTLSDLQGKFIAAVPRIRTETKSGLSIKGVVFQDARIISAVKRITEALPIIGPSNIQCFRVGSRLIFSEINPRFAGAHTLSIQAGLNSVHLLCKLFAGQKVTSNSVHIHSGVRMIRYWEEIFISPNQRVSQRDPLAIV